MALYDAWLEHYPTTVVGAQPLRRFVSPTMAHRQSPLASNVRFADNKALRRVPADAFPRHAQELHHHCLHGIHARLALLEDYLRQQYPHLRDRNAWTIRNAGERVTDDVIRSVIIAVRALGAEDCFIIHHTCCGEYRTFTEEQMRQYLATSLGPCNAFAGECPDEPDPRYRDAFQQAEYVAFLPYNDYRASLLQDVPASSSHPLSSRRGCASGRSCTTSTPTGCST